MTYYCLYTLRDHIENCPAEFSEGRRLLGHTHGGRGYRSHPPYTLWGERALPILLAELKVAIASMNNPE